METPTRTPPTAKPSRRQAFYDRYLARWLPRWAILSAPLCLVSGLLYQIANRLVPLSAAHDILSPLDARIPLRPGWIWIYLGVYVFWVFNFYLIARRGRDYWYRFLSAFLLSAFISFAIFILYPTTMPRPEITGSGVNAWLLRLTYAADRPLNLTPSLHCLSSVQCAMGLNGDRRTPLWYRIASYIFAALVCLSTLFVRQHCLIDVVMGVALAPLCWLPFRRGNAHQPLLRGFTRLENRFFG